MASIPEVKPTSATDLAATGRRHLAVRDYTAAVENLAQACELLAKEFGDTADQCAEAYLWYGKALLGLSREESGVLGDGMTATGKEEAEDGDNNDDEEDNENEKDEGTEKEEENDEESEKETEVANEENIEADKSEERKDTKANSEDNDEEMKDVDEKPGTSNGEEAESSVVEEGDDDVDNLQLAWEMLDLSRSILKRRMDNSTEDSDSKPSRSLLADVHLTLGEVALESETYDKAVIDMQSCLQLQKQLYQSNDRRIAETHYQIGLANSLASNFEEAIINFKNAANILETRIKMLENPTSANADETVQKFSGKDPFYTVESEIKELRELLPEIQDKIQDMMEYKAEAMENIRQAIHDKNGGSAHTNGASSSSSDATKTASNISHLIKRKRKSSEADETSAPKRTNTET